MRHKSGSRGTASEKAIVRRQMFWGKLRSDLREYLDHLKVPGQRNAKDFLFPGEDEYADRRYPDDQLAMLAVKTSCKDRWRQVLAATDRIRTKHLLTLEPAISMRQAAEMQGKVLQLVLPASLHSTYQTDQCAWLIGVGDFLAVVRDLRDGNGF